MARLIARGLIAFLVLPYVLRLLWRSFKEPLYRRYLPERFGFYQKLTPTVDRRPLIWVHLVSLGETQAARPLLEGLRQQYPNTRLLLTHGTATGRQAGKALLAEGDLQAWGPVDTPGATRRFLAHYHPIAGLLFETEIWPELLHQCQVHGVPTVLVNARMSERSLLRTLQWGAWLMRPAYASLALALPQSAADQSRLQRLGARCGPPLGNIKFDHGVNPALTALGQGWRGAAQRPVVVLASSREGEEALWLSALQHLSITPQAPSSDLQWLIVPRHPQRFNEVAALLSQAGWQVSRRSTWADHTPPPFEASTVWLGDSLGEMGAYYTLADCALIGGTFLPLGGQNLIEACRYDCPVILGPSIYNFAEAAQGAINSQAAQSVPDIASAITIAQHWLHNADQLSAYRQAARQFAQHNGGATVRTLLALREIIAIPGASDKDR